MTKRRIRVLVYICTVLLWGGSFALCMRSSMLSDVHTAPLVLIGLSGLAALSYPVGMPVFLLAGTMLSASGIEAWGSWFIFMTLLATLAGYWQWFHLFPRLFVKVAHYRESIRTTNVNLYSLMDCFMGMKRSRAIFFYISAVLIIGLGPSGLTLLPYYWTKFQIWLLINELSGFSNFVESLISFGLAGLILLTFPAGSLSFAAIGLPLIFLGLATLAEVLFLVTPLAALLGALQWFWLLPKLYRPKPKAVADVF